MFIILSNKNRILDIKAHEEMLSEEIKIYHNPKENKWAIKISGKINHDYPIVETLGEGWIQCED